MNWYNCDTANGRIPRRRTKLSTAGQQSNYPEASCPILVNASLPRGSVAYCTHGIMVGSLTTFLVYISGDGFNAARCAETITMFSVVCLPLTVIESINRSRILFK
jgi:hypothetical protein